MKCRSHTSQFPNCNLSSLRTDISWSAGSAWFTLEEVSQGCRGGSWAGWASYFPIPSKSESGGVSNWHLFLVVSLWLTSRKWMLFIKCHLPSPCTSLSYYILNFEKNQSWFLKYYFKGHFNITSINEKPWLLRITKRQLLNYSMILQPSLIWGFKIWTAELTSRFCCFLLLFWFKENHSTSY